MAIALQNLAKDKEGVILGKTIGVSADVFGEGTAFKQFHDQIDEVILDDDVQQFDHVFVRSALDFAQVAEGGYFAAEKVAGDFVVHLPQIDGLDCNSIGPVSLPPEVHVASGALPQQLSLHNAVVLVDGPDRLPLHLPYYKIT
jgi:hypothetical protein